MLVNYLSILAFVIFHLYETDLGSGYMHLLADTFMDTHHIRNFHHVFPRHRLLYILFRAEMGVVVLLFLDYCITLYFQLSVACWTCRSFVPLLSPLLHHWTHMISHDNFLMRWRIIISTSYHHVHHIEADKNFCMLNGWAANLMNRITNYPIFSSQPVLFIFLYVLIRAFLYDIIFCLY